MLARVHARADDNVMEDQARVVVERSGGRAHDGEEILARARCAGLEVTTHVPSNDRVNKVLAHELVGGGEVGFVEARKDGSIAENAADIRDEGKFMSEIGRLELAFLITDFLTTKAGDAKNIRGESHREWNSRGIVGTIIRLRSLGCVTIG